MGINNNVKRVMICKFNKLYKYIYKRINVREILYTKFLFFNNYD